MEELKIEVGKKYKARNGAIVYIPKRDSAVIFYGTSKSYKEGGWYFENGMANSMSNTYDLIEEVKE